MTAIKIPPAARRRFIRTGELILLLLLWGFVAFALADSYLLATAVEDALTLCVTRLIPTLFPIAAAGGLLTLFAPPPRRLCKPIGRFFHLSDESVGVLLISLISGFPIGAMLASRLREARRIGPEEASRLAAFTNNASAAFYVSFVGRGLFHSAAVGWLLWGASIAAALTVGRWMALGAPHPPHRPPEGHRMPSPGQCAASLKQTAKGMVYLCAFVVFFAVFSTFLRSALCYLLPAGSLRQGVIALLTAVFELTGGALAIAELSLPLWGRILLLSGAAGFGGLSVLMQCLAAGKAADGARLFPARLWTALLSALIAGTLAPFVV